DDGAGGSFMGIDGGEQAVVTVTGIEKGGKDLGTIEFGFMDAVTAAANGIDNFGSTMNDFLSFMEDVLGLDDTTIAGETLGVNITINAGGQIVITGNEGTVQDLDIETADLVVTYPPAYAGPAINQPFVLAKGTAADGESVRTSFVVYDSLGTPLTVDLTFVLQQTIDGQGTVWEFVAESGDDDDVDRVVGLGVVSFDENGEFVSASNESFSVDRGNGAVSPLTISMDFNQGSNQVGALTDSSSNLAAVFQDGSPIGTLASFSIGEDGTLTGAFTNGLARTLGQIALAKFPNPVGMVDVGNNYFSVGANAGSPIVTAPLEFGTGRLLGGALELSNVDLSQEFIGMILASTGYSASSRVITTTDELIDQLLVLGR
ncbi:MAG: flagellar hook-basal body complex protein, partial [Planctomycetota bacterium]